MKTILDEFERKTVEMHQPFGTIHITGWVYGEIAVLPTELDGVKHWCLNCVPRGVGFPTKVVGLFRSIEDACGAAKALARLNNCWAATDDISKYSKAMREIGVQFNGKTHVSPASGGTYPPAAERPFLNGASRDQYI